MAKTRIELNSEGIKTLLQSPEMQNCLGQHANRIATNVDGEAETYVAQTRVVAEVKVKMTSENMDDNTLLKALR